MCACIWGEKNDEPSPSGPGGRCPLSKVEEQLRTKLYFFTIPFLKMTSTQRQFCCLCTICFQVTSVWMTGP